MNAVTTAEGDDRPGPRPPRRSGARPAGVASEPLATAKRPARATTQGSQSDGPPVLLPVEPDRRVGPAPRPERPEPAEPLDDDRLDLVERRRQGIVGEARLRAWSETLTRWSATTLTRSRKPSRATGSSVGSSGRLGMGEQERVEARRRSRTRRTPLAGSRPGRTRLRPPRGTPGAGSPAPPRRRGPIRPATR